MAAERHRGPRASRLWPGRWPVRWRLAAVAASLTFLILLAFAIVVGRAVEDRLVGNFREDIESTAGQLALNAQLVDPVSRTLQAPRMVQLAIASDAAIGITDINGYTAVYPDTVTLPPVDLARVQRSGAYEFATRAVQSTTLGVPLYIQFGRDRTELDRTIDRMWLVMLGGILVGTMLAALGGMLIAGRAMRPVSNLTSTARKIATTRDPSVRIPEPNSEDEIAELARTLDDMLRELDAARAETQQMVQSQREFVADASHELRTPLTSILANLELLQDRLDSQRDREASEMVGSALRSSQRMRRLVADLLVLARADAGRHGQRLPCDLRAIATAALDEVRAISDGHEIEVGPLARATVEGDSDDLHRVVVNLLENAISHTPAGTTVRIEVTTDSDRARLEVADDGPGIPPGIEEQIFSRFVRADGPADLSRSNGTGLGLAIVKAVTVAHGGSVTAGRSAELGGASFVVTLPLSGGETRPYDHDPGPSKVSANV